MSKHSKGNWYVDSEGSEGWSVNCDIERNGKWKHIAAIKANKEGSATVTEDEAEANAHLIVAAPDLLAACRSLTIYADKTANCNVCAFEHLNHANDCPVESARIAIVKAMGRQP